jgi:hypothetical protein
MSGIMYNGIKYMCLLNNNNLKQISLQDNVYFTLKDIFLNVDNYDMCNEIDNYMFEMKNDINNPLKIGDFEYSDCLYDVNFVKKFFNWLNIITPDWFSFEETKGLVREKLYKLEEWEAEDIGRDIDRQDELSDYDIDLSVD